MSDKWIKLGEIGVDAGLCWIGDPCYVLHQRKPKSIGKNWNDFCDKIVRTDLCATQFDYELGHPGLGVCVETGYGDGHYDVLGRFVEDKLSGGSCKRLAEVRIVFIGDEDEDCEEDGTSTTN